MGWHIGSSIQHHKVLIKIIRLGMSLRKAASAQAARTSSMHQLTPAPTGAG